ncbi:MAG: pilus assembly PilX N-terminal domain-containing protein, partial [bacterium]|nr:pilus assembly PilX N-terminal domain-containing protein [bacterium]
MEIRSEIQKIMRDEKGGILITVLIIATIFAVLAYITLQVSITSLDSAESHRYRTLARMTAEGGLQSGAAQLREDMGGDTGTAPHYLDPSYVLSISDDLLRQDLINPDYTTSRELDSFPRITERTAYTFDSSVSTYSSDTDLVPGSQDEALYRYHDDLTFSEDYPGYEFSPLLSNGNLIVYGVGEVTDEEDKNTLFKFLSAQFPSEQYNFDVREAGVTEPSKVAPYPYIQTEHPYSGPESKAWTVTYQQDPGHTGRSLTGIRLMANPGEVQIDIGDFLYISGWLKDERRFQDLSEIELYYPDHVLTDYTNAGEVFSFNMTTTTIELLLKSQDAPTPGMDFGFAVSGVRYKFDSDRYLPFYETPHPYDEIVPQMSPGDMNIQAIYSPYQAIPMTAEYFSQRMRIKFDPNFSLDDADTLFIFNASDDSPVSPVVFYDSMHPMPADFYTPQIGRVNPDLPLGFLIVLARTADFDTDGTPDYGYKVASLEYTDATTAIVQVENPIMESPHTQNLASNGVNYNFPPFLPIPIPLPQPYAGYQTIYKPFCPNTDAPSGVGTVDDWHVSFSEAVALATSNDGVNNADYIRVTTPGNPILGVYDTVYFADINGFYSADIIDPTNNWYDISLLNGATVNCGSAGKMEIAFYSDKFDQFDAEMSNFGYRIDEVGYETSDGADDDHTPPTIRSDAGYPLNQGYPAFGDGPLQRSEWWYTYNDAKLIGLHFDRYNYDIEPGDRLEIYN